MLERFGEAHQSDDVRALVGSGVEAVERGGRHVSTTIRIGPFTAIPCLVLHPLPILQNCGSVLKISFRCPVGDCPFPLVPFLHGVFDVGGHGVDVNELSRRVIIPRVIITRVSRSLMFRRLVVVTTVEVSFSVLSRDSSSKTDSV